MVIYVYTHRGSLRLSYNDGPSCHPTMEIYRACPLSPTPSHPWTWSTMIQGFMLCSPSGLPTVSSSLRSSKEPLLDISVSQASWKSPHHHQRHWWSKSLTNTTSLSTTRSKKIFNHPTVFCTQLTPKSMPPQSFVSERHVPDIIRNLLPVIHLDESRSCPT